MKINLKKKDGDDESGEEVDDDEGDEDDIDEEDISEESFIDYDASDEENEGGRDVFNLDSLFTGI